MKNWIISDYDKATAKQIMTENDVDALTAVLLSARGITDSDEIERFFSDEIDLIDPFTLPDMDIAVERIGLALDESEKIAIFGDFDADGITSTAMLYLYLKQVGASVSYYIPDRIGEGYGLNKEAIDRLSQEGVSLIITVDNGISAFDEIAFAMEKGIDVVVTDHHMQGAVLPEAVAVVNPHRNDADCEYKDWAGVGVTFKLICALNGSEEDILTEFADLIAIGTVADIVPVLGENRIIIKSGLESITNSNRLGLVALKAVAGLTDKEITSTDIAFALAPRINAAGRIGSATKAVELLTTEDPEKAIALAQEIHEYNVERVRIEAQMFEEALLLLDDKQLLDRVIVVCSKNFNSGVAGIVASRLCERFGKPCIVITDTGEEILKGSCRSLNGFNIFEALSACCDSLVQFGGHTLAAGLSVERKKLSIFKDLINDYAAKMYRYMPSAQLLIDFKINPASISLDTIRSINAFQPFGMQNPKPLFGIYKATILTIQPLSGNKHIKITFGKNETTFHAVYFGHSTDGIPFRPGDETDIAVSIEKNEYYGKTTISLIIKAMKYSAVDEKTVLNGHKLFEIFMREEMNSAKEIQYISTNRNCIAFLYRYLRDNNGWAYSLEELYMSIRNIPMNYSQFMLSIAIMLELELLIHDKDRERYDIPIEPARVNIPDSVIFKKMQELRLKLLG